jgi:erythromycin esterase-like protein
VRLPEPDLSVVAPHAVGAVRAAAVPLLDAPGDYDRLLERIGDARFVLLGEETHGTHEFYAERTRITRRLVEERGFRAVAVEADWPDAWRVNRHVRGLGSDPDAASALASFRRFPTWMWRNRDVVDLVRWLKEHGKGRPLRERPGFYGLDLYSLHASMEAVLSYLDMADPAAARRARTRYACFDRFGASAEAYARQAAFGVEDSCEEEVLRQLREMHERRAELAARDGRLDPEDHFHAVQSARVVAQAEAYYREMFRGRVSSWNLRDRHMADSLVSLAEHLDATGPSPAKVVVWAHNSHVGDARATEMGSLGEWTLGQLVRERFPGETFLVAFTTHRGAVTAARDWDAPAERRRVRPALPGSYGSLFHAVGIERFLLLPRADDAEPLPVEPLLERAIGVVYRPETERASHYFEARLARQVDAVVHVDETTAVEPLERTPAWDVEEAPETYPTGL